MHGIAGLPPPSDLPSAPLAVEGSRRAGKKQTRGRQRGGRGKESLSSLAQSHSLTRMYGVPQRCGHRATNVMNKSYSAKALYDLLPLVPSSALLFDRSTATARVLRRPLFHASSETSSGKETRRPRCHRNCIRYE